MSEFRRDKFGCEKNWYKSFKERKGGNFGAFSGWVHGKRFMGKAAMGGERE